MVEPGPAPRILLVDDDPVARTVMRAGLDQGGFEVAEAEDGQDALDQCQRARFDLLIVDVIMPRLDGFELCRALRGRSEWAFVPILMATGLDDVASIVTAYDAGATDFIVKPAQWMILNHRVRYMLRAAEANEALRQAEERALSAMNAAEASDRAKTTFLANMSHNLRTPLNAIIGFSEIMHEGTFGPLPERYVEYASMIGQSGKHLAAAITDILELTESEASRGILSEEHVDIPHIVAASTGVVQDMAKVGQVTYAADLGADLPAVWADPAKLRQILINLLSNAVKFTPPGGRVTLRVDHAPARGVAFRIEDTGVGIAAERISLVTKPFNGRGSTFQQEIGGIGLGLPLTKRLVELHGGTLEISSQVGQGTTVTVSLPAQRVRQI